MNSTVTKKELIAFAGIILLMIGSLVYGYLLVKEDKPKNCWDNYTTEESAIEHCEGVNQ